MAPMALSDFHTLLDETADRVTVALDALIPRADGPEAQLMAAMRYAALGGGKRLRPFFVLHCGRLFDLEERSLLRAAAALECVHTYSLVHDDLPCMDDDDVRRGRPTVHRAYDEATAVLAGDALLTLSFEILCHPDTHDDAQIRADLAVRMAKAAGAQGMAGGQMIDILSDIDPVNGATDAPLLSRMQRMKTGALIGFAAETGAVMARADHEALSALTAFAHDLGLAYQIIDDVLDATGDEEQLGKAVKKDHKKGKVNFVTVMGVDAARAHAQRLGAQAKCRLDVFGQTADPLRNAVDFVLTRDT